jgi:hypothetical protein
LNLFGNKREEYKSAILISFLIKKQNKTNDQGLFTFGLNKMKLLFLKPLLYQSIDRFILSTTTFTFRISLLLLLNFQINK